MKRGFFHCMRLLGILAVAMVLAAAGPCREVEAGAPGSRGGAPDFHQVGVACWSLVGAGAMGVAAAALAGGRPKSGKLLVPASVEGQNPVKLDHSTRYVPPPHRWNYRSSQRRW